MKPKEAALRLTVACGLAIMEHHFSITFGKEPVQEIERENNDMLDSLYAIICGLKGCGL